MVQNQNADTAEFEIVLPEWNGQPPQQTLPVFIDFGALSHPGRVRKNNEDHFLIFRLGRTFDTLLSNLSSGQLPTHFAQEAYCMVVADGMGGMAAGEVASSLAIRAGVNILLQDGRWTFHIDEEGAKEIIQRMERYCHILDKTLAEHARMDTTLAGMGTTLTVAYSAGPNLFLLQVGDSRAYLFRDEQLFQVTHDQTVAQALADNGLIDQHEVSSHKLRHVLTNALGGSGDQFFVDIQRLQLNDGDRLLLCSDGLTDMVTDEEIIRVMKQKASPQRTCQNLVDLALANGGSDNVTVMLGHYHVTPVEKS